MATILLDIFPATGHYNASLLLARKLAETNKVVFLVEKQYEKLVRQAGFEVYLLRSYILPNRFSIRYTSNWLYWFGYCLSTYHRGKCDAYIKNEVSVHKRMLDIVRPDLVLLDSHHFYKQFVYDMNLDRILRLQTMQSTQQHDYIPPICYDYLPSYTKWGSNLAHYLWKWYRCRSKMIIWLDRFLFPGQNLVAQLDLLAKFSGRCFHENVDYSRYSPRGLEFKGGAEIVIPATVFDFLAIDGLALSFNETGLKVQRQEIVCPRYINAIEQIMNFRSEGICVVYVSLGTLSTNDKVVASCFFRALKKVCKEMEGRACFILSISKSVLPIDFIPYSPNMFLFKRVPQLHLLQYCDLMITHGGMNSITECIHQEVPMIVYPLSKDWDQPGNAARVVYHGLGLKGDIRWATPRSIGRKIAEIRDNYGFFKNNIRIMKTRINSEPDTAINYINSLLV